MGDTGNSYVYYDSFIPQVEFLRKGFFLFFDKLFPIKKRGHALNV